MADSYVGASPVWPYYSSKNLPANGRKTGEVTLGQEAFLQLLVAQLKHQDPLQPVGNTEFLAQTAQFAAVEQMTLVAKEMQMMRQSAGITPALIGKTIEWYQIGEDGTEQLKSGIVEAIVYRDGIPYAVADGETIPFEAIGRISETGASE